MLRIAFKEWAVVCSALAAGDQALILRKGGIAEVGGEFRPEHSRFWLYPTYLHEDDPGIKSAEVARLQRVVRDRPPANRVLLSHFAEVADVHHVTLPEAIDALADMHIWSDGTIQARYRYRRPGLYVLTVRVFAVAPSVEIDETPQYAGCRTWVELNEELPMRNANPVLDDRRFEVVRNEVRTRLQRNLAP